MAVNKIEKNDGTVIIDLTGDTVTPQTLLVGFTALNAAGEAIEGAAQAGGGLPDVITAGDTPILMNPTTVEPASSSSLSATGISITIPKSGTYRFKWEVSAGYGTTRYTQLYKNGKYVGSQQTASSSEEAKVFVHEIACVVGDIVEIYCRGGSSFGAVTGMTGRLTACIDWDNGFQT